MLLKTRMERYFTDEEESAVRTRKNQDLYQKIYNDNDLTSSNVTVLDNASEIDISKIKELVQNREGYKRVRDYQSVLKTPSMEDEQEEYDIYEDIDNKIYDINMILEDAKSKRGTSEREKYRSLRNTQYDILSKLDLNEVGESENKDDEDEMATDFFTQDKTGKDFITSLHTEMKGVDEKLVKTSADLFSDLRGSDDTILTEAITEETAKTVTTTTTEEDETFYTSHMSFTKEDFEGFQNLQTTVKKNNRLIKILIAILIMLIVATCVFVVINMI